MLVGRELFLGGNLPVVEWRALELTWFSPV